MPEFILSRSDNAPARIVGERLIELGSSNAALGGPKKQWFNVDLYRTLAGTHVAHVRYRGGTGLHEESIDAVYTGKTAQALMDKMDNIDTDDEFVTGWPHVPFNIDKNAAVSMWADREFRDVLEKCRKVLIGVEIPEEIL